eukprot:g4521.t1
MNPAGDPWRVLGVSRGQITPDELRKRYLELAKQFHPDRNKNDPEAVRKFKEINEAYESIRDGRAEFEHPHFGGGGPHGGPADNTRHRPAEATAEAAAARDREVVSQVSRGARISTGGLPDHQADLEQAEAVAATPGARERTPTAKPSKNSTLLLALRQAYWSMERIKDPGREGEGVAGTISQIPIQRGGCLDREI